MKREGVESILDKNIIKLFDDGLGLHGTIENIFQRGIKFRGILLRDFKGIDIDLILSDEESWSKIESSRMRYYIYYINHCNKRIIDINWILHNRLKFVDFTNKQIFKLMMLKDKLSVRNSVPVEEPKKVDSVTLVKNSDGYYFECNKRMK
jgi:hypothetical protein